MVDVVISIAAKVAELMVVPVGKHICYPFKYNSNMDELKKQVEKLKGVREMLQHSVDEAKTQGDEIEKVVEKWLTKVDEFTEGVVKPIVDDQDKAGKLCSIGFCPNLMARYSLSKKAAKTAKKGIDLCGEGKFEKVSYRPLLRKTISTYIRGYEDFDSRTLIFQEIMQALRDDNFKMIGVYGMGGVGKTTLVKRVSGQAIDDKLFDFEITVDITETPDIKKIQAQIAEELGLKFHEEGLSRRAVRLRDRLKKEKKVLLVLDNIWAKLDLEAVGIPFGNEEEKGRNDDQTRCKILLTSRSEYVLRNDMNAEKNFLVEILSEEEAGNLFWKIVGDSARNCDFDPIGVEIIRYCAGLPVAIATIASALKKKSLFDWKDALDQLRRSNPRHIRGMDANVYSAIKLSYDFLESEEAKSLFLLRSLENASSNNSIEYLLRYCMGLGLFQNVSTWEQGRNRLHTLINHLKASCLLLDGDTNGYVKMHDIIHAVAVSIASTDKLMFNIQDVTDLKEMLEEKLPKDSTAISLFHKDVSMLPERLAYPKLKLFFLVMKEFSLQIPDTFFEGMEELKVLDMTKIHMLSLPSSLSKLTNLRMLYLYKCQLRNVAIIGELKRLEILCFGGSDIEQLPAQIGQLTQLRLLELRNCSNLKVISPNVLSSLTRLEELYMGNSFIRWEVEGQNNASLSELNQLSRLTTLEIHVLDAQIMPQDLMIFEKLERYKIIIGDAWEWSHNYEATRALKLKLNNIIYLRNGIKILLSRTEDLYLDKLKGVKNVLFQLNGEGFQQLKHLHVQNGPGIQYIVNSIGWGLCNVFPKLESLFLHNLINLEKIYHGQLATESFNKLKIIKIGRCDGLKHLFSFSIAKNLLQLQEIEVTNCKKLEEIVFKESHEQFQQNDSVSKIEFTQLRTLSLRCLPQLTSFGIKESTSYSGSEEIFAEDKLGGFVPSFSQNVLLPSLENLKLSSINIECMWLDQLPIISSCCQTLTSLTVEECSGNLKFLFSYSMVKSLVQLKNLEIRNCKSIEGIINTEELREEGKLIKMVFAKLINLQLKGLPNLTQFGSGNSVEFRSLIQLFIEDCPKLKTFSHALASADIKQGNEIEKTNCQYDIHPLFGEMVILPTLLFLNLSSIRIQTIWHNQLQPVSSSFQNLMAIVMDGCDTLKHLYSSSMVERLIQLRYLDISNCQFMEVVIINQGERTSNTLFPKLCRLQLKHLPKLTSFCNFEGKSIELPSLNHLWLENCPKMHAFVSNSPDADIPRNKEEQVNSEQSLHANIQPLFDEKVRIPDLKFLLIKQMDMKKIWHHDQLTSDSFSKMDYFCVLGCHNLLNIFPSNMLGRLQKIEKLVIGGCNSLEEIFEELKISPCMMEEVVANEDMEAVLRFVFPQLKLLDLWKLPSLRSFYQGLYILEWPKLKKLEMWRCNKVEMLTSEFLSFQKSHGESQPENSIQKPLFIVDKVAFPQVEQLTLEWNWIVKEILHGKFTEYSSNLEVLELRNVSKQSAICPCCLLYTLPNLERLHVYCDFFEEIFICEELDCKIKHVEAPSKLNYLMLAELEDSSLVWEENSLPSKVFQNLTTLEVSKCNNLKTLVQSFVSFQNLSTLEVSNCNGLVNLLVVSVAKSLVQLTRLKIIECKMIEKIVTHGWVDETEDMIIFNQLKYLELHCLPRLTSFCSENYVVKFPSLQQVVVGQCQSMRIFSHGALSTPRLHKLQITKADEEGNWEGDLNTIQKMFKEMVGFRGIENFTFSDFPHLKEVWHNQLLLSYFSNLKSLVVDDKCRSLRYIFTPSVALGLVQLQELEIKNCAMLEAIIVIEDETIRNALFPNLNKLDLTDLPKLAGFCNFTENAIELPSLATLWIDKCPNMETFIPNYTGVDMSTSKDNLHIDIQPLFNEKIRLPNLKVLFLDKMDRLRKIWHHQLTSDSFCDLESLEVYNCHNLMIVFPSNMLGRLQKLDKLCLRNCSSLDEIFELQASICGKTQAITATQLRKLELNDLPKLKHVWNMDSQGLLSFPNLLSIKVTGCDTLKRIFPASVGRNLLRLEELWIENCCMVEEIFAKEEEVNEAVPRFPRLTLLILSDLSRLQSFYPMVHISEWPMLKRFYILGCDKIEISASKNLRFQVSDGKSQHEMLLLDKVPLTNLERLGLDWKWIEKEALHEKLPEYLCKLKFLTFNGFRKGADICVFCFLNKLPNLEKLQVTRGFFKEVFLSEGLGCEEEHVETPSKLSVLRLVFMYDSLHLWEEKSLCSKVFQNLAILEVVCCDNLKSLVPSHVSFQNLTTLEVLYCNELLNLVAVSTVKSLVQLTKLSISECKMIEEIIIRERDEVEDCIIFKKLRYVKLECLPSLTSFYSGTYTIELPSLQQVVVRECPKMQIFSQGILNTPRLHKLQTTEAEGYGFWEGDLNTTIEHLFIEITGRWPPKQRKIAVLVNQVHLLRCNPVLVARNDLKICFVAAEERCSLCGGAIRAICFEEEQICSSSNGNEIAQKTCFLPEQIAPPPGTICDNS
ncbi:hypothetical protein EZV62_002499 [Acer yangbiense]|uniref:Uncharacterized protein n=1 Tax=Acer yangbiense TaxID=1000413 RepID=A0A5C7IXB0_9ROSI|nr:hypothetical protein EZV62_002499 [Acer yangbiense]